MHADEESAERGPGSVSVREAVPVTRTDGGGGGEGAVRNDEQEVANDEKKEQRAPAPRSATSSRPS